MKDRSIPDEQLIEGCIEERREAQNLLYTRYARKMFGVCLRYAPDKETAEDILQDGFVKVFTSIRTYKGAGSFEGWIRRIMVNTALSYYQKRKPLDFNEDMEPFAEVMTSEDNDPEEALKLYEGLSPESLLGMIQDLPDGYRLVMNLYVFENQTHKDIAHMLGITENTSKSQLSKARRAMRRKLEELSGMAFAPETRI